MCFVFPMRALHARLHPGSRSLPFCLSAPLSAKSRGRCVRLASRPGNKQGELEGFSASTQPAPVLQEEFEEPKKKPNELTQFRKGLEVMVGTQFSSSFYEIRIIIIKKNFFHAIFLQYLLSILMVELPFMIQYPEKNVQRPENSTFIHLSKIKKKKKNT